MNANTFKNLTLADLAIIVRRHANLRSADQQSRQKLHDAIAALAPEVQERIGTDAEEMVRAGRRKYQRRQKRTQEGMTDEGQQSNSNRKRQRVLTESSNSTIPTPQPVLAHPHGNSPNDVQSLINSSFMKAPLTATLDTICERFIDATSNEALATGACASCARETDMSKLSKIPLADIDNRDQLKPVSPHPAHVLTDGILLYRPAILQDRAQESAQLCNECLSALRKNKRPKLSLANNMWIGETPPELKNLTLPERMLIAKYYPVAYIVKLFPKHKGSQNWDRTQMHNGLKGNVSTYRLDPTLVASMIDGSMFPPPARILSATIGVTFVGPKGIPERSMPNMFRVRRRRVRDALIWLQQNNSLYQDIQISEARLQELPEDNIPEELLQTARHSTDIDAVEREHAGYVPTDAEEDIDEDGMRKEAGLMEVDEDDESQIHEDSGPEIIPVQSTGIVDIDGVDISDRELMAHALANSAMAMMPEDFTVKRGSAFVNEYARVDPVTKQRNDGGPSNPNHLLGCFPTLFPYGKGGFETDRPENVPYELHARWALLYADKRFRRDPQFPFQVFGVCQKRAVCRSAVLQIKKSAFTRQSGLISSLKPEDLLKASEEEMRGARFSNPAVQALRNQLSVIRTKVKGTDESRQHVRSKIWSTNLIFNAPSLWVTFNPADSQDPIVQVMAGEDIDLNAFCNTAGPTHAQRAKNVAEDPFAAAKFFNFIVKCITEILLGLKKGANGKMEREEGIFGQIQCYIATVEAQGRGTLHLHMLIWLRDTPIPEVIKAALLTEEFRMRVTEYIRSIVRASIGDMTQEQLLATPKAPGVSYSRPLDPRTTTEEERSEQEKQLARALQFHKCTPAACLRVVKNRTTCKRRAPWRVAPDDWVDENGNWGPKRIIPYLNNWNPTVLRTIRSNHDVKLIMSGGETALLTFYIANYATKKQQKSSNVSALLAKALAFVREKEKLQLDLRELNKKLMQKCANTLNRDREFSGPEIMTYLMGWPDVYESHHYATIYWDGAVKALKKTYPELGEQRQNAENSDLGRTSSDEESEGITETQTIGLVDGKLELRDQLRDYQCRGGEMEDMSFMDFITGTYEGALGEKGSHDAAETEEDNAVESNDGDAPTRRGRPPNRRVAYKEEAGKPTRCRVFRTYGHETLPRIAGKWLPRSDDPSEADMHKASILLLLRPWRRISDIKGHASFADTYQHFIENADQRSLTIIRNIQYYYEGADGAKERKEQLLNEAETIEFELEHREQEGEDINDDDEDEAASTTEETVDESAITDEMIEAARKNKVDAREKHFGKHAINSAIAAGLFTEKLRPKYVDGIAGRADIDQCGLIKKWEKELASVTKAQIALTGMADLTGEVNPEVVMGTHTQQPTGRDAPPAICTQGPQGTPGRVMLAKLNKVQRRAHDIIEEKLREIVAGTKTEQLKMLILGQAGTGKSTLISAITETFEFYGKSSILAKCATTGVAACDIGGQTLHSWAGLYRGKQDSENWIEKGSEVTKQKRKRNVDGKKVLIVDEISMSDKDTLQRASEVVTAAKHAEGDAEPGQPFGGMHVILTGDFHQFPPVPDEKGALYVESKSDKPREQLGRNLFTQFETVVILEEQNRVRDPVWNNILQRVRVGECDQKDIETIRRLVLTDKEDDNTDYSQPPWDDAILVTPRHTVREKWNKHAILKHCAKTGKRLYIVNAEDTVKKKEPTRSQQLAIAKNKASNGRKTKLQDSIRIAVGMKAMVMVNLSTEAEVANGTRGIIEDIVLDYRETDPQEDEKGAIRLKYPPAMLLFRPDKGTKLTFPGLPQGIIPITPTECTFQVTEGKNTIRVKRRQYAITPGYAFTDYKSQGQTIEYVVIDLAKPPTGRTSAFAAYVALSRSRGRDTIRLLRDFNEEIFEHHPSEDLRKDMKRLEALNKATEKKWGKKTSD